MASRPILPPQPVIVNGNMANATIISAVTVIQNTSMISYDISWSGSSPVGAMTVQVSDSYSQNADGSVRNAGSWTTVPLSSPASVSGNTGNGFVEVVTGAYAVRLVYTKASGTGTMQAIVSGKVQ